MSRHKKRTIEHNVPRIFPRRIKSTTMCTKMRVGSWISSPAWDGESHARLHLLPRRHCGALCTRAPQRRYHHLPLHRPNDVNQQRTRIFRKVTKRSSTLCSSHHLAPSGIHVGSLTKCVPAIWDIRGCVEKIIKVVHFHKMLRRVAPIVKDPKNERITLE